MKGSKSKGECLGVIFDLDGTLVASEKLYFEATERLLNPLGHSLRELTREEKAGIPGRNPLENMAFYKKRFGLQDDPKTLADWRMDRILELLDEKGVETLPCARRFLEDLRESGFRLALASSSPSRYVMKVLAVTRLAFGFDVVIAGDQCARYKPDPEIFLRSIEALGVSKDKCVVFEDSHAGMLAAKQIPVRVVGVRSEYTLDKHYSLADLVVTDFCSITAETLFLLLES
jgi:beta-phosphoglucomutase